MPLRVIRVAVDPKHDCEVDVLTWRRDQYLPRAALEMQLRALSGPELAGGLDHDVGAKLAPVDLCGVSLGQHRDRDAADDQRVRRVFHRAPEPAEGGIEGQQVCQRPWVGDVVDRYHLQVGALKREARERAPDAAETVDS